MCGDEHIQKKLSAPRLNLGAAPPASGPAPNAISAEPPVPAGGEPAMDLASANTRQATQAAWLRMMREVMARTEDVGERFAEEARKMHYGESEERGIRGQATPAQTEELLDEGIAVMPLPIPAGFKNTLQ